MNAERGTRIGLAILAKAPVPGLAKTRLIPHLGAEGAAALQRWLLQRIVTTALAADIGPVTLWCTPDIGHPAFAVCSAFGPLALRRQPDGDLGERMLAAIAGSTTPFGTVVVGTDCPLLTPALLRRAADALARHDATVVPADDGGYVLIGMRRPSPRVFTAVDWGSGHVMDQTRARLSELGWRWKEFESLRDVDCGEDLAQLTACFPDAVSLAAVEPISRQLDV
ncbi:MAG: TIGR04282 family arsenosugar biosynthesis glycosyltransferase [Dechloromonas sp.]|uniref:TIGR04282 family arsenosugar biosynthesis glycosyltransferase n=1 Tax=Candidatus Dechloromonas phosphorivorans TaxID=2899244 RepID=A0A9D7LNI3_9RHOO|nr:TIGR04282 family arsenosugar biosynthesis glycosyltransferase [Candidatus Dechloromonas phosphorivorans]